MKKHLLTLLTLLPSLALAMVPLEDNELAEVTGQSLLVADYIAPSGASGSATDFHYYRMGLDALVELNMNIDKLQLGCGGYNEAVRPNSCDIDMDYVRFMGRYDGVGNNPNQPTGAGKAGDPVTSDFEMMRPYFEIAVRDIGGGQREIAGFKVSAEYANGFFGVGSYEGGVHTGINSLSGAMNVFLSGYAKFSSTFGDGQACIGRPTGYGACASEAPFVAVNPDQTKGVRMTELSLSSIALTNLHGAGGLLSLFEGSDMFAQMKARLIELHGFELAYAEDFFVAFQREPIEYPKYNKEGYSTRAETGWWMNAPRVELADLEPAKIALGCPGFACLGLLDAFSEPGIDTGYPDMRSRPPTNCYGDYKFC